MILFRTSLICSWAIISQTATSAPATVAQSSAGPDYDISGFTVEGRWVLSTNALVSVFSKYAKTNATLQDIIHAASDLELAYIRQGYPTMNIVVAPKRIANGIVTLDVFPGAVPQVVVAGNRYVLSTNGVEFTQYPPPPPPPVSEASPRASARTATNAGPRFAVNQYQILGNTLLPPETLSAVLTNVPGAFGTNVSIDAIRDVVIRLDTAYRAHGYVTAAVGLPPQRLTNATVKLQVTEGRIDEILVKGNHYFSSNNVMRAVPGLYRGMILNGTTFQAEVDRANANQDRQISPIIDPGPDPGTSDLTLQVKDRLPLHAKIELNNENSPGTPDLRVNSSAVYNNLWQLEQSVGVQYSFSPDQIKQGHEWSFYDLPAVANYSAFYRIPLGGPEALDDEINANPGSFGYDEATRKFKLPPAASQPALTVYGSRSTIDTGIEVLSDQNIFNSPGVRAIKLETDQQDNTVNQDLGFRLSLPFLPASTSPSTLSGGLDFKTYSLASYKTNIFTDTEITYDKNNNQIIRNITTYNPVPNSTNGPVGVTASRVNYLPLAFRYDGALNGSFGTATFGLGIGGDVAYSGSRSNLQTIAGSTKATGHWVVANPSFSWQYPIHGNWLTTVRADGQVASEPLISNEQYGAGGVNSVRGYHEGEVFGDDGWHVTLEQQTPPHTVGIVFGRTPLVIRGSIYTDYAHIYLLDPNGRPADTGLWGTGVGIAASIGSFWQTRMLMSVPLLNAGETEAYHPYFNFSLTAQF